MATRTLPVTPAQIREDFPEFANTTIYSDSQMEFYLGIAAVIITTTPWGSLAAFGTELFVAHNIVLDAQAVATVAAGGFPGLYVRSGLVTSESAGGVSVSYGTVANFYLENGGDYNLTLYGIRFLRLLRMMGAGPLQL